eukprot:Gregarina_sp_Poly_1__5710@NODE_2_length_28028_cov_167_134223_g1_i0_p11_GENE_NODE_2_length_28028_cov_167_134223_g1_i0NODE_2_length_28028_cov_167_134223_g1_i0_p11_ORF_typecomplete_len266_score21_49PSS/PF03034_15/3_1e57YitT_membrane/PF02588_15/0_67YitT_membrane/PF02588_15/5_1e02_NODE_2_length_28028_cov_167_134223_g1_i01424715044
MFKALILRDWILLWLCSLLFELSEVMLRHILPNFWECWWDHFIMDIFGCNLLGIWLGMIICNKLSLKFYAWGKPTEVSERSRFSRMFFPFTWRTYSGGPEGWFGSPNTFISLCVLCVLVTLFDLNYFFLKAILQLEPGHWICLVRTVITGLAAAPALSEVQAFLEEGDRAEALKLRIDLDSSPSNASFARKRRDYRRLGVQAWLLLATLGCELLLILRWAPPHWLHAQQPWYSKALVSLLILLPCGILGFLCMRSSLRQEKQKAL